MVSASPAKRVALAVRITTSSGTGRATSCRRPDGCRGTWPDEMGGATRILCRRCRNPGHNPPVGPSRRAPAPPCVTNEHAPPPVDTDGSVIATNAFSIRKFGGDMASEKPAERGRSLCPCRVHGQRRGQSHRGLGWAQAELIRRCFAAARSRRDFRRGPLRASAGTYRSVRPQQTAAIRRTGCARPDPTRVRRRRGAPAWRARWRRSRRRRARRW